MSKEKFKEVSRLRISLLFFLGWARGVCSWGLLILFGSLAWNGAALADPISLYGNWRYQKTGNGETREYFRQSYDVDLESEITEAMTLEGSVRYNRDWTEGQVNELLYPTLDFMVNNDIFRFNLSGTATERMNSEVANRSDRSWNTNLYSTWRRDWWPYLRLSYGEEYSSDDQSPNIIDTDSSNFQFDTDWDLGMVRAFYNYFYNEGKDLVADSKDTTDNHFARLEFNNSFWDNRFSFGWSGQYSNIKQEFRGPIGTPRPVHAFQGFSGVDNTPLHGTLPKNPDLINGDKETSALEIQPHDMENIGVMVDRQDVDLIYLYTVDNSSRVAQDFHWDLYVSDNGSDWDLNATDISPSYNTSLLRFEFDIPKVNKDYIKLVAVQTPEEAVSISEMDVMCRTESKKEESTYENFLTDVHLGFRLTTDLNMNYSLLLETGTMDPGSDRDRRNQAGILSWTPSRYFAPSLSASENRQDYEDQPNTVSHSYSFMIASAPLSTLDLSIGATRNENYEDDDRQSTTHNYTLYTTAVLFPDLNSSLDLLYGTTDNVDGEDSRTYGAQCTLTARLSPELTADLTGDYNKNKAETDSESKGGTLTLNWRPSDIFSLRGSGSRTWEKEEDDTTNFNMVLSLVPTHKIQLNLGYFYADSTSTTQKFNFFWSWMVNQIFSVNVNGSYQIAEKDEPWSISGQLIARF
jgi:hypothetical protein